MRQQELQSQPRLKAPPSTKSHLSTLLASAVPCPRLAACLSHIVPAYLCLLGCSRSPCGGFVSSRLPAAARVQNPGHWPALHGYSTDNPLDKLPLSNRALDV